MESQPQNPEFRINPENFHPCAYWVILQAFCHLLIFFYQNHFFFAEKLLQEYHQTFKQFGS